MKTSKNTITDGIWRICSLGTQADDTDQDRLTKSILTLIAFIIAGLAIFWGALYVYIGYPLSGAIPLAYSFVSLISIGFFFLTKKFVFFRFSQFFLIFWLPFLLMWSLGGFANGSVVMIWAFFTPLAAMFFANASQMRIWLIAFVSMTIISGFIEPYVSHLVPPMNPVFNTAFFVMNMGAGFISVYFVLMFFVRDREKAHNAAVDAKEIALAAQADLEKVNTQLKENEEKIRELMLTDPLTGVSNRRHLEEQLASEFDHLNRYRTNLTLVITDIDHFKNINDTYGHDVGDHVLKAFAKNLKSQLRNVDFVARIGGEEFLMILPETKVDGAVRLVERIRQSFSEHNIPGLKDAVTASFGIAEAINGETGHECMKRADMALYQSKDSGRDRLTIAE